MTKAKPTFKIEKNILKGTKIPYPKEFTGLGTYTLNALNSNLSLVGQIDAATSETYTYGQMRDRSVRCALWLAAQGIKSGDVVAVISNNHMDLSMPYFAALYLGAVVTPLDAMLNTTKLHYLMNYAKPKLAFASKEAIATVAEATKLANLDIKIVCLGKEPGYLEFEEILVGAQEEQVKNFKAVKVANTNDTAIILGTSGTTGTPKCVAIGHKAVLMAMYQQKQDLKMSENIFATFAAPSWVTGSLCLFIHLDLNIPRLIMPMFEVNSACEIFVKHKVSAILVSPIMIKLFLKTGVLTKYDFSAMKYVLCGGSSLPTSIQNAFSKYVPNAEIIVMYGITEIGGLFSMQHPGSKVGSCGKITGNAQMKVVHLDTGKTLGANQQGELLLKVSTMMNFYYGNAEATAKAIDKEGWFRSGDLGYYDEDGDIFVIDRLSELVYYRDTYISPNEVESVILSHPAVREVAVVGLPHPADNEHPIAFVVKSPDSSSTSEEVIIKEIIDLVANKLPDNRRLRGGVRFVDHIPKTSSNKNLRGDLRTLARSMAEPAPKSDIKRGSFKICFCF